MRKTFLITAILLLSTAWAVAQTTPSSQQPTTPGASTPSSTMPSPQSSTPDTSSNATQTSSQTADNSTAIEGCLSGSSGSYTLTDQSGKAWQLAGDTSKLTEHVGHQVRVMGSSADSSAAGTGSSAASSGAGASAAGTTFTVKKVKMISASCSTSK